MEENINKTFDGKYKIIKAVNQGGMGIIFQAVDMRLQRKVAIKQMEKTTLPQMILDEVNIQKELDYPMFAQILDYFETTEHVYLVIEWIDGLNLKEYIQRNGVPNQKLANQWAHDIAVMLTKLHNKRPTILFQDLKPDNIMVREDGQLKLIDFGAATQLIYSGRNLLHIGTKGYASPEQVAGERLTIESDIYNYGTTLYSMLTGIWLDQPPYKIVSYITEVSSIDDNYRIIIEKATNENPKERFHSMDEIIELLEDITYQRKYANTENVKNQDGKMTKMLFCKRNEQKRNERTIRKIKSVFVSEKKEVGLW